MSGSLRPWVLWVAFSSTHARNTFQAEMETILSRSAEGVVAQVSATELTNGAPAVEIVHPHKHTLTPMLSFIADHYPIVSLSFLRSDA